MTKGRRRRGFNPTRGLVAAEKLVPVPGRMQCLSRPGAPSVIVDYAHTPEALRHALEALRAHLPGRDDGDTAHPGQLWCLFGCGGERDSGKRALMGAVAEANADRWVITDDNPRSGLTVGWNELLASNSGLL